MNKSMHMFMYMSVHMSIYMFICRDLRCFDDDLRHLEGDNGMHNDMYDNLCDGMHNDMYDDMYDN